MISDIDLRECTQLIEVNLAGTGITVVDITLNLLLKIVNLEDTGISSLDISQNRNLEQIYISST